VHRENRYFVGRRSQRNTRAGGVSQPWQLSTRMHRRSAHTPSAVRDDLVEAPLQVRYPHPRRADARRSCFRTRRVSPNVCGIGVAGALPTPTAGSRPPLLFPHKTSVCDRVQYRCCRRVCRTPTAGSRPPLLFPHETIVCERNAVSVLQARFPNHGGLTPAAPDPDAGHARPRRFPLPVRCSYQRPDLSLGLGSGQKRCEERCQVNVSRFRIARWSSEKSDAGRSVK